MAGRHTVSDLRLTAEGADGLFLRRVQRIHPTDAELRGTAQSVDPMRSGHAQDVLAQNESLAASWISRGGAQLVDCIHDDSGTPGVKP